MNYPTIKDAQALAMRYRRRGVVVLSFGGDRFGTASYGMTRKDCAAMKEVSEQIVKAISSGEIELPDGYSEELQENAAGYGSSGELKLAKDVQRVLDLQKAYFKATGAEKQDLLIQCKQAEGELRKACETIIGPKQEPRDHATG